MSYLAFELDALNVAPAVARAAGIDENAVLGGLLRLWAWCFREKVDQTTLVGIRGHFGPGPDIATALVEFGFLEPSQAGFRVRGADRYLRIAEGRSKGGHASKGNLKKGRNKPAESLEVAEAQPETKPEGEHRLLSGSPPAHPPAGSRPCTEHRAPSTEHLTPKKHAGRPQKPVDPAPPDPRHAPLVKKLCDAFAEVRGSKYPFAPRDAAAVRDLLGSSDDVEALERAWRRALKHTGFPAVSTVHEFAKNLAHFVGARRESNYSDWSGEAGVKDAVF